MLQDRQLAQAKQATRSWSSSVTTSRPGLPDPSPCVVLVFLKEPIHPLSLSDRCWALSTFFTPILVFSVLQLSWLLFE